MSKSWGCGSSFGPLFGYVTQDMDSNAAWKLFEWSLELGITLDIDSVFAPRLPSSGALLRTSGPLFALWLVIWRKVLTQPLLNDCLDCQFAMGDYPQHGRDCRLLVLHLGNCLVHLPFNNRSLRNSCWWGPLLYDLSSTSVRFCSTAIASLLMFLLLDNASVGRLFLVALVTEGIRW